MTSLSLLFYVGLAVLAWALTHTLRRPWHPRFAVEIAVILLCAGIATVAYLGADYERTHVNRGEAE